MEIISNKTVAEYFAGIGLIRLGLEEAGWNVAFANDIDPKKFEMYSEYFHDNNNEYLLQDVFSLMPSDIPATSLATASFPCIDLSVAGNQNGLSGKFSSAFWGFINVLGAQGKSRPPIVMLENVPGWLSSNRGEDFRITVKELNKLGYICDVYHIDARRFTPQSRQRIFLIGWQSDQKNNNYSEYLLRDSAIRSNRLDNVVKENIDLNWHFRKTPKLPKVIDSGLDDIMENIDHSDLQWWNKKKIEKHIQMMPFSHFVRVEKLRKNNHYSYRTFFRRNRNGEQRVEIRKGNTAGCLRTARGGSSRQFIIKLGNGEIFMRNMSPREYARLQGVPDSFPISRNDVQSINGFGDAVCVPVIKWIGTNILDDLFTEIN